MSRRRKIVIRTLLCLLLGITVFLGSFYLLLTKRPHWYAPIVLSEQERGDLFNTNTQSLIALATAVEQAATLDPQQTFTFTINERQLYVYYDDYVNKNDTARAINEKVQNLQIRLRDGNLIIAGRIPGIDSVVSAYLGIEKGSDGNQKFKLFGIYGGSLPMPDAVIAGQREIAIRAADSEIARLREIAPLEQPDEQTVAVLTGMNAIDLLNGKTVDSIVILQRSTRGCVYARVVDAKFDDGTATITFRLATPDEVKAVTQRIRKGS